MLYIILNWRCYINNKEIIVKGKKKCHNLFVISLVLFIIQVIIHIMGYFITGVFGIAFLMEIIMFILWWYFIDYANKNRTGKDITKLFNKYIIVVILVAFYSFISFFINLSLLQEGSAESYNNKYFIENHGTIVREVDYDTYKHLLMAEYRLFTGHNLVFFIVPTYYFYLMLKSDTHNDNK